MIQYFIETIQSFGVGEKLASYLGNGIMVLIIVFLCIAANAIAKGILLRILTKTVKNNRFQWDDIMLENKVFHRFSHLIPPLVVGFFAGYFPKFQAWIERGVHVYLIMAVLFILDAFINSIDEIYRGYEISKIKPIKGLLQVVKILVFTVGGILIVAALIGQSPMILLGGIGALTAVVSLVFKDSILGFVAGVQLTSNDMVRIGDWIEVPKYGADGTVIDLSLTTVKVANFDHTITTLPAYALVSDSFKNWRGMQQAGGRRIKRSIVLDATSVVFCTEAMLERYEKIQYLKDYIAHKRMEIQAYNQRLGVGEGEPVNGRRLTNLGTFRAYIMEYLKHHPGIHQGMTLMVRQLESEGRGIPLEVYAFTNTTEWVQYETIQGDIFDHLFAVAPQFGLRVFQEPTGNDLRGIGFTPQRNFELYQSEKE